ncbi:LOW QUALITY PROTEIN: cyclic nucleotide-gated olfactory channel [Physeter macrocephalus]|uniref:LOW QUALITY PROTEIN: cyclic nucleotide-gated olfactory channel n=1 Tax=Physeter macrocephalus TaxID=9755 RepID=A0A455AR36_PHYMC|nr:LOW QUALITY PROTEIN: cyclic nucleotide-gated olfactory channel [Physeter catodon]|eukprot:XP_028338383.1 LOW QUALITY PROTEIN: cyclic nucleotide-gated olfactory channel [Physeter catodon]
MTEKANGVKSSSASNHKHHAPPAIKVNGEGDHRASNRPQSAANDDTSSELQRLAEMDAPLQRRGGFRRIACLVGVIREWPNKSSREEEPRPDSFLERFCGPELQTVTTQQGDGKGDKDSEGKGTKYSCPACGAGRAPKHAIGGCGGVSHTTARG